MATSHSVTVDILASSVVASRRTNEPVGNIRERAGRMRRPSSQGKSGSPQANTTRKRGNTFLPAQLPIHVEVITAGHPCPGQQDRRVKRHGYPPAYDPSRRLRYIGSRNSFAGGRGTMQGSCNRFFNPLSICVEISEGRSNLVAYGGAETILSCLHSTSIKLCRCCFEGYRALVQGKAPPWTMRKE